MRLFTRKTFNQMDNARKSNSTSGGIKKSTSIFGKRPGTMKNKTKELKIVFTEFMSFSQKNDQESPG